MSSKMSGPMNGPMSGMDRLQRGVAEIAHEIGGTVAVVAHDLCTPRSVVLLPDAVFPAASVIKVPILVELMYQVESGRLSLSDRIALSESDMVAGSGVLSMLRPGLVLTLEDLAHLMITVSDNTASNMLLDRVGIEAVGSRLRELGFRKTRLERKFYDFAARERGLDNWASAGELADLLTALEQRRLVTPAASARMLGIMRRQQFTSRIPRLLPPEIPVAHKTGSVSSVCHDIGIIYSPAGPLVLVVLTQGIEDEAVAEGGIRHIARLVYSAWGMEMERA